MRYPLCKGGCGMRLVTEGDPSTMLKGGRRRAHRAGYCQPCWTERAAARAEPIGPTPLTPEQAAVLRMLENEVDDEAERRDFAEALGLVGETA